MSRSPSLFGSRSGEGGSRSGEAESDVGIIYILWNAVEVRGSNICTVRLDQVRTVDRKRLLKMLGTVDEDVMRKVDEAISISLGLVKL